MKKAKLHVISHTHWDREWYQDFQGFRQRLVYQTDALLDLLEAQKEYKCFHFDGQVSCLLDYLEIRPENRERLKKHIQSGRIAIGPWFVMPDELLLCGESLVRNLMLGHKICEEFGAAPTALGNVVDIFGHCSQLPQILKGFGIDAVLLHRGTSGKGENSEMVWEGADTSKVLLIKVYPFTGYCDILYFAEISDAELPAAAEEYEKNKLELALTDVLYGLDGNDHTPARWDIPAKLSRLNAAFKSIECVHSTFADYLTELKNALKAGELFPEKMKTLKGELRVPANTGYSNHVINGIGSSRLPLKQRNDALEQLLSRVVEPLHAWSSLCGGDCQKPFLNLAWKYLLLNHPHDSIVGCSIDQVHRDMIYRFDQAQSIALNSVCESIQAICADVDSSGFDGCSNAVHVFNISSAAAGPVLYFDVEVPSGQAQEQEEQGLYPVLTTRDGTVPCQCITGVDKKVRTAFYTTKIKAPTPQYARANNGNMRVHRYRIALNASLSPLGSTLFGVKYSMAEGTTAAAGFTPVTADAANRRMENALLRVQILDGGRVELCDLETGAVYENLMYYEDCGDAGNGWNHCYPEHDVKILSTQGAAGVHIELIESNPFYATFKVSGTLVIPKGLNAEGNARLTEEAALAITSFLTLKAGEKRLECKTIIDNTAECHRLKVLFPSGQSGDFWFADTAFDAVKRNVKVLDTIGWNEQACPEGPFKNFFGMQGETGGLAVITKGICEGCVQDDSQRTLALTLFRSFTQDLEAQKTTDSLLLQEITVEYAVMPLPPEGRSDAADLFYQMERYKYPLLACTAPVKRGCVKPDSQSVKPDSQFVNIGRPLVLSTIKTAEKNSGIIIRLFNPLEQDAASTLRPCFDFVEAWETDMLENKQRKLKHTATGEINLNLRGKQIFTILLKT
jgi:alpha-mannosidase/mannosylglycerate hydrolase